MEPFVLFRRSQKAPEEDPGLPESRVPIQTSQTDPIPEGTARF